ncbi:hypothetical protein HXX01_04925 [Candidatus Nomurabacteria bacterium]|nr:hypothetical protein [Candidatus Nomurabacteria bacterium]
MVAFFLSKLSLEKINLFNEFVFKHPGIVYTEELLAYAEKLDRVKNLMDTATVVFIDQHIDTKHFIFEKYVKTKEIPTIIIVTDLYGVEYCEKLKVKFPESKINMIHFSHIKHSGDVAKHVHNILQSKK